MDDTNPLSSEQERMKELFRHTRTIAVVGLSPDPSRDSNRVAAYLLERGFRVIPVNPKERVVLGQKSYPDLASIPEPVDVVDVFRASEHVGPIAQAAVEIKAKGLWLQLGVSNDQAVQPARQAGLTVVQDKCIKVEHRRLLGQMECALPANPGQASQDK